MGDVTPNSPAREAGLKKGDIILDVNGQAVSDANQLRLKIGMLDPNSTVESESAARRKTQEIAVAAGRVPLKEERASVSRGGKNGALQGVTVENLLGGSRATNEARPQTKGVVVDEVSPASRAADAGLQPGDVIQQVNHQPVQS